jgi:hypothetical protein
MSLHQAFRRQAVPQQVAQQHSALTIPAPTRGITDSENLAFMRPGAAIICDNWVPTMRGVKLRGGCIKWCELPERVPVVSAFEYQSANEQRMFAGTATTLYDVTAATPIVIKASQTSGNYVAAQLANAADNHMIVANEAGDPLLRFDGVDWEILISGYVPPAGKPSTITGPTGAEAVAQNLTYVWKYRNRLYFIEGGTMNAWYLPLNAVGGTLAMIPLSGAASKGGKLLWGAVWSIDAGDGTDDKCVFATDQGEILIFTGSDPSAATNWRQEGRYQLAPPMGMNAHMSLGGELLIETVEGIVPLSQAIIKERAQLELATLSVPIKRMWRDEVAAKRTLPWTMKKWEEYGAIFVAWPGGDPGNRYCAMVNSATGAWARFVGWDATCFIRMRADMFFGTQDGIIMQADRTGYDDGKPYVATLVGGWGALGQRLAMTTWLQARCTFEAGTREPFVPQVSSITDYEIVLPTPPPAGPDLTLLEDVWDQGKWGAGIKWSSWANAHAYGIGDLVYDVNDDDSFWTAAIAHTSAAAGTSFADDRTANPTYWTATATPVQSAPTPGDWNRYAQWDQPSSITRRGILNTRWVSVGATGFIHAPVVQATIAQKVRPNVELIAIDAIFAPMGTNV